MLKIGEISAFVPRSCDERFTEGELSACRQHTTRIVYVEISYEIHYPEFFQQDNSRSKIQKYA